MSRSRGYLSCVIPCLCMWGILCFEASPLRLGAAVDAEGVELVGAPVRYAIDVERYRFGSADISNPGFYPIPADPVNRGSYLRALEAMDLRGLAAEVERGMDGPRAFMPVLVKYVQTGDAFWGEACVGMLKAFHVEMERQVSERKWFWQFEHPAALVPLYHRYLIEGGMMSADAAWFREMWLFYCRNLHVWDSEPVEWRGGCHRSMPEGLAKGLAAKWYPDIPEAGHWAEYSSLVFGDFWRERDVPQNDTGYSMGPLIILACVGDQWLSGDDAVYRDSGMARVWDRLLGEISPDGAINPYGPNGGWNSTADYRIAMLERLASKTGDGRYRYGAHRLFNYLRYQTGVSGEGSYRLLGGSPWLIALAWLFADDSIAPVEPSGASHWSERVEAIRVPHTDKALTERLMGHADERENFGHICCSWYLTGEEWPDKLVLRDGWDGGGLFALVELHPTSFPANPGGIMALNRWAAPFTQIVTSKGASVENRVMVRDVSGGVEKRLHPDKLRIDEFWRAGQMPDIRSYVTYFKETEEATYARLRVENLDGLPVTYHREFVFAKGRFLATREIVTFEESFRAEVAPLWNTHNIGPQLGGHWANTFIHRPVGDNGSRSMLAPPADLLVWFAPRSDCRFQVVDRLLDDPRAEACPNQVRYLWEGKAEKGQQLVFTQVYYPHMPYRARAKSNNPGSKAAYDNDLQATAHASGIQVIRDEVEASVLRLECEPGLVEWVIFNPEGKELEIGGQVTRSPYSYLSSRD